MFRRLSYVVPLVAVLSACGGGGMAERDPENGVGVEEAPVGAETPAHGETPTSVQPTHPAADVDADAYRADLTAALYEGWNPPNRDSSTPARIGVVIVHLGPQGRVESWSWRRRSPRGTFNDSIAEHMDHLVSASARAYPLPPEGSDLRQQVLDEGIAIEFADDDT